MASVDHSDIDHTGITGVGGAIDWGETGDITDQDYDDVADAGVLNEAARADHLHGMPSASGGTFAADDANSSADFTTTSNSLVDVTGATVTISTGARRCLVTWTAVGHNSSATDYIGIDLNIDGTGVGGTFGVVFVNSPGAAEPTNLSFSYITEVLTAASHTFKIQARRNAAGTVTIIGTGNAKWRLAVAELP